MSRMAESLSLDLIEQLATQYYLLLLMRQIKEIDPAQLAVEIAAVEPALVATLTGAATPEVASAIECAAERGAHRARQLMATGLIGQYVQIGGRTLPLVGEAPPARALASTA